MKKKSNSYIHTQTNRRARQPATYSNYPTYCIRNILYFLGLFMYLEVIFHLFQFSSNIGILLKFIMLIPTSVVIGVISNLFREKVNKGITILFTCIVCIYYCTQMIYHSIFQTYMNLFGVLNEADQALDFITIILKTIGSRIIPFILLLVPIPFIFCLGRTLLSYRRRPWIMNGGLVICALVLQLLCNLSLFLGGTDLYSVYDVYYHNVSVDMAIEKLGVLTAARLDAKYFLFGSPHSSVTTNLVVPPTIDVAATPSNPSSEDVTERLSPSSTPLANIPVSYSSTSYNVLDIDFDTLISNSPNDEITMMHNYFKMQTPTKKNTYTGLFKDYNVIFITAEGLSKYVFDETRTPTLWKLAHEGFVFSHYYSPLWYGSTCGGEYANLVGAMPKDGGYISLVQSGKNETNMLFTLGKQLSKLGYKTVGYHDNDYTYYSRQLSFPNMGYEWFGTGHGFIPELNASGKPIWPQSDQRLIEQTFDLYRKEEPFHVYYLTVSGHVNYSFNGNSMSMRNKDSVKSLNYSDTTKAYLACQMELEKAMTSLVNNLQRTGLDKRTLLILAPDHIPYDNKEMCDELAGHTLEEVFEWCESNLIIWSGSMTEPITVDKYCSSIDILPTISNLLGLSYDSRLLIGQDILSDSPPLVMFKSRSFITDRGMYNAKTNEITSFTDHKIDARYITAMNQIVRNKFDIANMMLDEDYYSYIEPYLN